LIHRNEVPHISPRDQNSSQSLVFIGFPILMLSSATGPPQVK
jgi:hypothetical protein